MAGSVFRYPLSSIFHPRFLTLLAHALAESTVQALRHRAALALADVAVVPPCDPGDLARGAGDEQLIGALAFFLAQRALFDGDAGGSRAIQDNLTGDAGEDLGAQRVRDELAA